MSAQNFGLYAPNLICICLDRAENGDYAGHIWHQYQDEPIEYKNTIELIREMDALYDQWNFPQRSTEHWTFINENDKTRRTEKKGAGQQMDTRRIQDKKGDKGTFIVHVKYRQNSTWQGEVIWAERKQKQYFRSALELLKLVDSALDEAEENTGPEMEQNEEDDFIDIDQESKLR